MTDTRRDTAGEDLSRAETRASDRVAIGPYRVITVIGAGGMGQVLRAHDSKLNRDVALKLLPGEFATDPERLARFTREAHVLASFNHPNIGAIYGLEESDGRPVLVLELVEGQTLAERIASGPLPLIESLSIARQVADALDAAHAKGIIHRDLKPANLKITASGNVKVLDFGLAKTSAPEITAADYSQSPASVEATRIGSVLGTAPYMSPEQARGLAVDSRADIWAFGCVLFEMLTGRKAFGGATTAESITKILERDPDWSALPKTTPVPVVNLLRQCLQKEAGARLASIAIARDAIAALLTPKRFAVPRWAIAAVALVIVLAASFGYYAWRSANQRRIASPSEWTQITRLDSATQPALSPDGRMLAFVRGPSTFVGPGQVYMKLLPDGEPVQLTHDDFPKMSPVFSPDGTRIAYTVNDGPWWDTWEVPAIRGEPRRWLRNASGLTWLAPGDLLYSEVKTGIHMAIVRSGEADTTRRDLYLPVPEAGMAHRSYASPDRTKMLVVEMDNSSVFGPCLLLNLDGSTGSQPAGPQNARCTNAAWSPDGRWMYFTADAGDGAHVWRQRFPNGVPEQLTFGATEEEGLALAPDGNSVITSVGVSQRSVWLHDAAGDRQISVEGYAYFPLISSDGSKIVFRVTRGIGLGQSPSELWVNDVRSGQSLRLFPTQLVTGYDVSRDDDRVAAAVRDADGRSRIWLGWLDNREPPHPVPEAIGDNPRFAIKGTILFRVAEGSSAYIYKANEDGTNRERLFESPSATFGTVSPDGEWLSHIAADNSAGVLSAKDRQRRFFPYTTTSRLRWTPDGARAYVSLQYGQASAFGVGRTFVLPLANGSVLPPIPQDGYRNEAEVAAIPGAMMIPYGDVAVASTPGVYVYSKIATTRNLYRIPLQ